MTEPRAVPPTAAMHRLITGYQVSRAIYVAATLGIADMVHRQPQTAAALAEATDAHADTLYRVMRALASVGIFSEGEDGRFHMTELAETLRSGSRGSLRDFSIMVGSPEFWLSWGEIMHSVRTGGTAFNAVFGSDLFEYMAEHTEFARIFDAAMTSRGAPVVEAVVKAHDFSGARSVVDVGGGQGSMLAAILRANPGVRGVLFDLPHVVEAARSLPAMASLSDRLSFVGGSFFDAIPRGHDIYLEQQVVHDWDDARAGEILQTCRTAMTGTARLLLVEMVVPPGNDFTPAKWLDLMMLMQTPGGRERTESEYRVLLASAGFELQRVIPTASPASIIEAAPA